MIVRYNISIGRNDHPGTGPDPWLRLRALEPSTSSESEEILEWIDILRLIASVGILFGICRGLNMHNAMNRTFCSRSKIRILCSNRVITG